MGIGESIFLKATRNAGILARAEAETLFRRNLEAAQRAGELSRDQDPKSLAKYLNVRYRLFADIQFTRTIIEGLVVRITRRSLMPYVNVRITKGVTREQKAQLVREITDTLVRVLAKKPEHTHIVIDEVDEDNWGFSGMLTTDFRKQE